MSFLQILSHSSFLIAVNFMYMIHYILESLLTDVIMNNSSTTTIRRSGGEGAVLGSVTSDQSWNCRTVRDGEIIVICGTQFDYTTGSCWIARVDLNQVYNMVNASNVHHVSHSRRSNDDDAVAGLVDLQLDYNTIPTPPQFGRSKNITLESKLLNIHIKAAGLLNILK